jgi:hypothetical protein
VVSAKPPILRCVVAVVALVLLSACQGKPPAAAPGADAAAQDGGYVAPPRVEQARAGPAGVELSGAAAAGAKVRLATPAGEAMFATADPRGRWRISLPPAAEPRIFGLSAASGGRSAQAQGYVLVTPDGQAALLRAGAGAERIGPPRKTGLSAIDFDRGGGVLVSASVPPGATVILDIDGRSPAPPSRANALGAYQASLGSPTPIKAGAHLVKISGDGFADQATVQVTPAAPLAQGPLRSQLTSAGLRVDWLTPGGGVQSTILVH